MGAGSGRRPAAARARAESSRRRGGRDAGPAPARPPSWAKLPVSPAARRGLLRAAAALVVALGLVVRIAAPWPTVFAGLSGVRLFDTDSYYHLRHARYAVAHFPHLQAWDPGVYPDGQPRRYAGLFDVSIAAAALVAGAGHPSEHLVAVVAAFTPAVLGALALAALFWLGATTLGEAAGLVALLLVTLYPGTFIHRSLLGAVDHHVAEVLLALLTALAVDGAVRRAFAAGDDAGPAWHRWLPDLRAAAPLAVFFFTWFGAPIYLVLIAAVFFLLGTLLLARGDDVAPLGRAAFRFGAGLLLLVALVRVAAPGLVMETHTLDQALLATALFALGLPAYLLALRGVVRRLAPGASPSRPSGRAAALALLGALVVLALATAASRIVPGARTLARSWWA